MNLDWVGLWLIGLLVVMRIKKKLRWQWWGWVRVSYWTYKTTWPQ